jgi:crotonobetainyl-CoA:carnitine CoA-transferase CaiB-like acyl-CoA transferase
MKGGAMSLPSNARSSPALPLAGVRVLDLTDGTGQMCARLLADLGADVLLVEPPGGMTSRRAEPVAGGISLRFAVHNANKRSEIIDWRAPSGRDRLLSLVQSADILISSERPGTLTAAGLGPDDLHRVNPRLVVTSISDFGQTGPYRDWVATSWVHMALNSVLSRSGLPGQAPLMPPGQLADETACTQAAWATLIALWAARHTQHGEHVDVSILEASLQTMDAPYGPAGSATVGVQPAGPPAGRPDARHMFPIFPCADGYVRICVLARRQWRAMFGWLGEPAEFADPKYDLTANRFAAAASLHPLIGKLFADQTRAELVSAGQQLGVPIASVQNPAEVLHSAHFRERGSWQEMPLPDGTAGLVPSGFLEVDGQRAGIRSPAPAPGSATGFPGAPARELPAGPASTEAAGSGPLAGLRVLDLGVIVVGADTGRMFADEGADVIKIESRGFPDGSRQALGDGPVSPSFVWGHRNKRSLGLDLRSDAGREIFMSLVAASDLVLSNFRPGTLESLGLGYTELRQANPSIVVVDSSAMGSSGPESRSMGYGPLVRATTGLTALWSYPGQSDGFSDATTIYPDHTSARIGAVGALAKLIARASGQPGGTVSVAQAEVMLNQFGAEFAAESLAPGSMIAQVNAGLRDVPYGVYPCAGEDQWCAITIRSETDWERLCAVIGAPDLAAAPALRTAAGRVASRAGIEGRLTAWTTQHDPQLVMRRMQDAGIPAGAMRRDSELRGDAQLRTRRFFTVMLQPELGELPAVTAAALFQHGAGPHLRPSPAQGEHTEEIARELLGLPESRVRQLIADGVLEPALPRPGSPGPP